MKEKIKKMFYFLIKVLFFLSIPGFFFLILNDRNYGGGPVIFVFSMWGLLEYIKWIIRAFKIVKEPEKEPLGKRIKREFGNLNYAQQEYLNQVIIESYEEIGLKETDEQIINTLRKLDKIEK